MTTENLKEYERLTVLRFKAEDENNSEIEDSVLDSLDILWYSMSREERMATRDIHNRLVEERSKTSDRR